MWVNMSRYQIQTFFMDVLVPTLIIGDYSCPCWTLWSD